MSTTVILGAQWGDEGKGKLVDVLAGNSDWVARFQEWGDVRSTADSRRFEPGGKLQFRLTVFGCCDTPISWE